ncbi:GTPase-activator protein, putative [Trichomonas vaginalis G3]|uniref:GTPase-activator protein, putative n=1 Tax=Trichomonas vaginalis (strain ATCC PRA-98 / G3) TaxID=412133 RepID=A2DMS2_TRIV3|nr:Ras GTPase-activating proteins family [Trichomonas vaginalis G3]EAY18293.1 GTPase-activator protein, putative [Trichomonas vaginalis G3]KAI5541884.1 Ras GTPase-activating proteins family [Trichomonas vaginalis G3]|eukprot:XP_001579279.1 GTPase-activator protein [Trichomonas vaginalis G3]
MELIDFDSVPSGIRKEVQKYSNDELKTVPKEFVCDYLSEQIEEIKQLASENVDDTYTQFEQLVLMGLSDRDNSVLYKKNLIEAYLQILVEISKFILHHHEPEFYKTFNHSLGVLTIAYDKGLPTFCLGTICNLIAVSSKMYEGMDEIIYSNILREINNYYNAQFWGALITDVKSLSSGFNFLAQNYSKLPEQTFTQFIYELEYAIFRLYGENSEIFKYDLDAATLLFMSSNSWKNKYTPLAKVVLTLCIPEKMNKGNYSQVYKDIKSNIEKKQNVLLQARFIQPLCKIIALIKGTNKTMIDTFNETTPMLVDNMINSLPKITAESLLYILLALFYAKSPKFDKLVQKIQEDITLWSILPQFVENVRDIDSPQVYNLIKFCLQCDMVEMYQYFDAYPKFFANFMVADSANVDIIFKKLMETNNIDLISAIAKFFTVISSDIRVLRAFDFIRLILQLGQKLILSEEPHPHVKITYAMYSITDYTLRVAKVEPTWAIIPKIVQTAEAGAYLALSSTDDDDIRYGYQILCKIAQIGEIAKINVELAYKELNDILKTPKPGPLYSYLQLLLPFSKVTHISPTVSKVITYIFYTLDKYKAIILSSFENQDQTDLTQFQFAWTSCLCGISLLDSCLSDQIINLQREVMKINTQLARKFVTQLSYIIHPRHLTVLLQKSLDRSTQVDFSNPEVITITLNILTILRNLFDHPKTKEIDYPLLESFISRAIKIAHVSSNVSLTFTLCQVTQRVDLSNFDEALRTSFIQSLVFWISQTMIQENELNTDALITILVTTLIKLVDGIVLKRELLRSLLSALVLLIKKRPETAILVQECYMNIYKENSKALVEDTYILSFNPNDSCRMTFIDSLLQSYEKFEFEKSNDSLIDDFFKDEFIETFSETCPQNMLEPISLLFTQSAIVRNYSKKYIERMVKLELKNTEENNKNMILRGNGISSRSITYFAKYYGQEWVLKMFKDPVERYLERIKKGDNFEINPAKGEVNTDNFLSFLEDIVSKIDKMFENPPEEIVFLMRLIYKSVANLFDNEFGFTIAHGFLFLRLILPTLSIPDSFGKDIKQSHKDPILNASVVIMAAINKGYLNEKKPFYHVFNDFGMKTRTKYINTMKNILESDKIKYGEYTNQALSVGMLENRLISHLAPVLQTYKEDFCKIETNGRLVKAFTEYNKYHNGHPSSMNVNALKQQSPEINEVVKSNVPAQIAMMMANTLFRVNQNLIVFKAINLPAVQIPQAFQKEMIALASEQKEDLSVIMDFTGYSDKDFDIGNNVHVLVDALPHITDLVKELIILNGSETIYDKFDTTPIRKKVISAEKYPEFDLKFAAASKCIHERINAALMSIPFNHNGSQHTCNLMKNCIIVSHNYGSRIAVDYFPHEEIDTFRMEQNGFTFSSNKLQYTINCSDQNFASVAQLTIINTQRIKTIYMNPANRSCLIYICRLVKGQNDVQIEEKDKQDILDELVNLLAFGYKDVMRKLVHDVEPYLDTTDKQVNVMYSYLKSKMV